MEARKLKRFRKLLRSIKADPTKESAFASKIQEMGKTLTPEVKQRYSQKYGVKFS